MTIQSTTAKRVISNKIHNPDRPGNAKGTTGNRKKKRKSRK